MALASFELSLSTAPLDELERVARQLDGSWLATTFAQLEHTEEATILATCSRREIVVLVRSPSEIDRWAAELPPTSGAWKIRTERETVRHLYRVAAGLESMVLGEKEVRDQVRAAARTTQSRHRHRLLRELFGDAARAADRSAPSVPRSCSISAVAATRILELSGRPFPRVLVVGAGTVGRAIADHLAASARLTLAYRTRAPDPEFLRATGARAVRANDLSAEIALSDVVVTAAKSGDRSLGPTDLPVGRPLLLVDLGMPRNIDPAVRDRADVRLVDLAELRASLSRVPEPPIADEIERAADRRARTLEQAALEPWVAEFRREIEALRTEELRTARRFLGPLDADQEIAVDRLTRRLVERLVHRPTEALRCAASGEDGARLRRLALELWRSPTLGP